MSKDGEVRDPEKTSLAGVKVLSIAGRQTDRQPKKEAGFWRSLRAVNSSVTFRGHGTPFLKAYLTLGLCLLCSSITLDLLLSTNWLYHNVPFVIIFVYPNVILSSIRS